MCNDLGESRASIVGWVKLLISKLNNASLIEDAFKYLIPDPNDPTYLKVDKEKCVEGAE